MGMIRSCDGFWEGSEMEDSIDFNEMMEGCVETMKMKRWWLLLLNKY